MVRVDSWIHFNGGSGEGQVMVHWIEPKIMDPRPDLP
jgi:hypothetical protein